MWASDLGFDILGTRFRLQSQDASVASEIERLWGRWRIGSTAARLRNTYSLVATGNGTDVYRDCSRLLSSSQPSEMALRILMDANRQAIHEYRGFAAHAAVLASPQRVAAILGESGVGKTTLAASAVLAGLAYGSDEALCVDRSTQEVAAYPRPLGLSAHSQELLGIEADEMYRTTDEAPIEVGRLGGSVIGSGRQLTDIILPERTDEEPARFDPLGPADAATALLANSFNHFRDPQGSYLLTASLAGQAHVWRLTYSHALESGRALADHLQ